MNRHKRKNVTTILALLAILVVIAAVAIPVYLTHRISERVTAAMQAADAAKLVVLEAATVQGGLDKVKGAALAYNSSSVANPYVESVAIADGGRISITTRDTGSKPDPVLLLTPQEQAGPQGAAPIVWVCSMLTGKVDATPSECRGSPPVAAASTDAPAAAGSTGNLEPVPR